MQKIVGNKMRKLVLANPPFGEIFCYNTCLSSSIDELHSIAKKTNRIEALMLVSNLSILQHMDYFGAVLPENFFTAEGMEEFRSAFLHCFKNVKVSSHDVCFARSEVRTRSFIGQFIGIKPIEQRKNDFHPTFTRSFRQNFELIRGIDNTKLVPGKSPTDSYHDVLHFNNPTGQVTKQKHIVSLIPIHEQKRIQKDDLLVVRVGRHAGAVVVPNETHIGKLISDYLIIIKGGAKIKEQKVEDFRNVLCGMVKGLTIAYVGKNDIWTALEFVVGSNGA